MTTITKLTKEQLIEEVKRKIAVAERHPDSDVARIEAEIFKIALASMEAKPVAWECGENIILFNPDTVEAYAKRAEISPKPLYTAPPAPAGNEFTPKNLDKALGVVGVALPESKEEFNFQIERWIQRLIDRVIRYADEFKEQPVPVVPEECPAELPYAQVKAAADLYALCWQSGEVVTYTPAPEKATIWLNNYSGTCVQEYVKLERLQEALSGYSPVIPDGWISCSERMPEQGAYISAVSKHGEYVAGQVIDDWLDLHDGTSFGLDEVYLWMMLPPLLASPQQ
ncbi:DUF551 domain-containing protein [Salmonella enterica]|nr:DUF551 domain-containing protein [Salmonella enterica]